MQFTKKGITVYPFELVLFILIISLLLLPLQQEHLLHF